VAGTTANFDQLEEEIKYPKSLKIFSLYILLPLWLLYFLILYAYGTKIVILWDWPKGLVSYLVIYMAALGIFAFLLLFPLFKEKEYPWVKSRIKTFYLLMLPLLALLFIAVSMRISNYGYTINRYLVLMLGIWLSVISFYFIFGKGSIKTIPMSLGLILLLCSFGPWGVFQVSEKSQVKRLEVILSDSKILVNGKINGEVIWGKKALPELVSSRQGKNNSNVSDSLYAEISSILYYLHNHHGLNSIKPWFTQDLDQILKAANENKLKYPYHDGPSIYLETLGLSNQFRNTSEMFYNFQTLWDQTPLVVRGYDYLLNFSINSDDQIKFTIPGDLGSLQINSRGNGFVLLLDNKIIEIPVTKRFGKWMSDYRANKSSFIPVAEMTFQVEGQNRKTQLIIQQINLQKKAEEEVVLQSASGFLLFQER
jgi:hypothetical protein